MDVTILNGKKHMKQHSRQARRLARHNPEGGLAKAAGKAALATAVAVPVAIVLDRTISGMKKGGTGADRDAAKYTQNQVALLELAAAAVIGVGLHVKDTAPTLGVAILAASGAVAGKRWYDARPAKAATTAQGADFTLTITPASATVTLGSGEQFRDYAVAVVQRNPAATITPVRLAVTGLTQGVTALVDPESITSATPGRIRLTVPATGASASTVGITVAGTNASGTSSVNASLVIAAADFTLTITPVSATVTLGSGDQFRDYAVAVVQRNPAATITPVRLAVTGLTQGVTALVDPESVTSATPGRIRLTVPAGASASTVGITVAGTNASGTSSVNASLVIAAAAPDTLATPPARLPFGMLRRAGAAYDMTYGQVSRSGEAISPPQPTVFRSNVVPVMATEAQIQGQDVIGSMGPMEAGGDKVPTGSSIERFIGTGFFEDSRQRTEEDARRAMPAVPPPPREGIARNPFANGCQCPPPPSIHSRRIYGAGNA
jgi:hypothetical protein